MLGVEFEIEAAARDLATRRACARDRALYSRSVSRVLKWVHVSSAKYR